MLELNKIYNLDALDGLSKLDDQSVDLIITSPPYNLRNNNGKPRDISIHKGKSLWKSCGLIKGYECYHDARPHDEYVNWQKDILKECWRCLKDTGAIFYNHKPILRNKIAILPTEYNPNLPIRQIVIWDKNGGYNFSPSFYLPMTEWIVIFAKKGFNLKSRGASGLKDIWRFQATKGEKHPATFPIQLPLNILETAKYKDIVVDPFMGSGTTAMAYKQLGSNYIGFELSKDYCDLAERRINEYGSIRPFLPNL